MVSCIIAFDNISANKLPDLVKAISEASQTAYIFFIQHIGNNTFSNGALFNIGVRLAGFHPLDEICFFSFMWNRWNVSQRVSVSKFISSNGYNNHATGASALDTHRTNTCGYNEIFAEMYNDIKYNSRCWHYAVQAIEDKILKLDFVQSDPDMVL